MGRIEKWSEHAVHFAGQRQMVRWAEQDLTRTRLMCTQSVIPVTGLTVNYGGATGFFDLHIDGWWIDAYECMATRFPLAATSGSLSFTITPLATANNTVRWVLWGR